MSKYLFKCLSASVLGLCVSSQAFAEPELIGGCVLSEPVRNVSDPLNYTGDIKTSGEFSPFIRSQQVYGLTMITSTATSDSFMRNVAQTVQEMFASRPSIDQVKQDQIMANLYRYRAAIPVVSDEAEIEKLSEDEMMGLMTQNSVCDIIMTDAGRGQVMEVVEHILHFVTDVGLHYTYPRQWGLHKGSDLYASMQQAISRGVYDVSSYTDIDEPEERLRVELQEYGYWLITSAWNLQQPYGPDEDEWTVKNATQLRKQLPLAYELYTTTVDKVLTAPSVSTLEKFNQR